MAESGCLKDGHFHNLQVEGNTIIKESATTGIKKGDMIVPCYPDAPQQAITGGGAITVTEYYTAWNTTGGAAAGTLAAGTELGQMKKIQLIVHGGTGTLTIANPVGASSGVISFADVGDFAILQWNGIAWRILELGNDADGNTAPGVS